MHIPLRKRDVYAIGPVSKHPKFFPHFNLPGKKQASGLLISSSFFVFIFFRTSAANSLPPSPKARSKGQTDGSKYKDEGIGDNILRNFQLPQHQEYSKYND